MLLRHSILRHLMSTSALRAPNDPPGGGGESPDDERIEVDLDDDEISTDPTGETEGEGDGEDDELAADDGADDGAGGAEPPARQPRGDRQFGELRRQAREAAEQAARVTRELEEMRAEVARYRQPPAETPQQRAERLALMSPEERAMEMVNEALERNNQQQQALTAQLMDQSDRSTFEARAAVNPLFKKLAPEVERELANLRAKGQSLPRETIAIYLIGQRVVAQQSKAKPGAKPGRTKHTARPLAPQGDAGGSRRRGEPNSAADFESRFGDVPI